MKSFLSLALILAACSHHSDPKTPAPASSDAEATNMVDPTLPSWAPKSCAAYHVAVVKAVDCDQIDQPTRTAIKDKYESANTSWHDLQNAQMSTIDQIALLCAQDVKYVESQSAGFCGTALR